MKNKKVFQHRPDVLFDAFNGSEVFANQQRDGNPKLTSAYRPIFTSDWTGVLLKKLSRSRLGEALPVAGDLSPRQFGFIARRWI